MADPTKRFSSVSGTFVLKGTSGNVQYEITGQQVPAELDKIPAYIADLVKKALSGMTTSEAAEMQKQNDELKRTIDKLIAENKDLKKPRR